MHELQRFIMVDNHEAVKIGHLEKTLESLSVAEPKFTTDLPDAVVREGADELSLRKGEEGTQRTWHGRRGVGEMVLQVCRTAQGGQH